MDFIRKNINVKFVMTGRPAREEVWDYPLEALREAVINAICHRDYTIPSNTEVRIYDDKLIVWNPGGLPLGLFTPTQILRMPFQGLSKPDENSLFWVRVGVTGLPNQFKARGPL